MNDLTRRQFVAVGATAAICLLHRANCAWAREAAGPVTVGTLADFANDGVNGQWARSHGFFIVREGGRLFAPSAICTHKKSGKLTRRDGADPIVCPLHGSLFTASGVVTRGPARRNLPRLGIRVDEQGRVIVNPGRQYEPAQWDDAGSFVIVKG